MIFAESILLSKKDVDGVLIHQVFYNCYYWQDKGQVFIEDLKAVTHQFPQKNVLNVSLEFKPSNVEPFKL